MDAKRSLGEQIRQAMARRQWRPTGAELARRYNDHYHDAPITEQTASAWLRGRRLPNAANLQALNTLLDTAASSTPANLPAFGRHGHAAMRFRLFGDGCVVVVVVVAAREFRAGWAAG